MDAASNGDIVLVADGTYTSSYDRCFNFMGITVKSENGPVKTILDFTGQTSGCDGIEVDKYGTNKSTLSGFTIKGAKVGLAVTSSSPIIENCVFDSCARGINIGSNANPTITGCTVKNSTTGGIYISGGSPIITDCTVTMNQSTDYGGGISIVSNLATPVITNCFITKNQSSKGGGFQFQGGGSADITNCVVSENTGTNGGGMQCSTGGTINITNCTFYLNEGKARNIHVDAYGFLDFNIVNSILWSLRGTDIIIHDASPDPDVTYSNIQSGFIGEGNISESPKLSNWIPDVGSPCIDAGTNAAPLLPTKDIAGNNRIANAVVDMGAYEYTPPAAPDANKYLGWWYVPNESGTGLSMQLKDNTIFLAWYAFDQSGRPVWYIAYANKTGLSEIYSGELRSYTGWPLGTTPFVPTYNVVGTVTLNFTDENNGTVAWDMLPAGVNTGTKNITRYMPTLTSGERDPREIDGWYIADGYSGIGFFIETLGDTIYLGWYHYRADGSPEWRTLGGWLNVGEFTSTTNDYVGKFLEFSGGQTIGGTYTTPAIDYEGDDTVLYVYGPAGDTVITLVCNGVTYNLQPFDF